MVRAAMAMGATVVSEEPTSGDGGDDGSQG
jgi:hypothetical protein